MLVILFVNILLVALVVVIHYEFLHGIVQYLPKMKIKHRKRIVVGVLGSLFAHTVEVWVFGIAYYWLNRVGAWGVLEGNFDGSLLDSVYFSFTVFTTLGFGDIEASSHLRFVTGVESLTGLVLVTWTASFLYIEMQRYWETESA